MQDLLEQQGVLLTNAELSHLAERYALCGAGKTSLWDVREYARTTGLGAREHRVVRANGIQDVYRSVERVSAAAVRLALNELESLDASRGSLK